MDTSRQIWMCHVTFEWVTSHYDRDSFRSYLSRGDMTNSKVTWHIQVTWQIQKWHDTFKWHDTLKSDMTHSSDITHSKVTWHIQMHYGQVLTHLNASCHFWMCHVTFECVMSLLNASCHFWMGHVPLWTQFPSHEWIQISSDSNVTWLLNEACCIINSIHVTRMNTDVLWFKCDMTFE